MNMHICFSSNSNEWAYINQCIDCELLDGAVLTKSICWVKQSYLLSTEDNEEGDWGLRIRTYSSSGYCQV
jgi:hypothetical protein